MRRCAVAALAGLWLAAGCGGPEGQWELEAGSREIRRGNFVRAKSLLEKSIARRPGSPDNAAAYNQLGLACLNLGLQDEAVAAFEECIRIGPRAAEPLYNLGVALSGSAAVRAVGLLREAAAADPADPRALEYLGSMYAERRQWDEARKAYEAALSRAVESPRVLTALALVDLDTEGPDKAVNRLMQALARNAKYAPAVFNLAVIYERRLSDPLHAEPYFKRFAALETASPEHLEYAKAALQRIAALPTPKEAAAGDSPPVTPVVPTQAAAQVPPAPERAPRSPEEAEVEKLLAEAAAAAQLGRAAQALDGFLTAAQKASAAGRADQREKALRQAKDACFDQPLAHYEMGRLLMETGRYAEAMDAFQKASTLDRSFARGHLAAAEAALKLDQADAAFVELRGARRAAPDDPDVLWALAGFYEERMRKPSEAAAAYADFAARFARDPRAARAAEKAARLGGAAVAAVPQPRPPEERKPADEPRPAPKPPEGRKPPEALPARPAATPPAAPAVTADAVVPRAPPPKLPYRKPASPNPKAATQAFNQAALYQLQKNWDQALYYYLRAVENDDRMASAFYNIGVIYGIKGEYALAKEAYLKALELRSDMVNARYNLALTYRNTRDNPSAVKLLRQVLQAQPGNAQAHYALGLIYAEDPSTIEEAKQHYRRFVELAPNDVLAPAVRRWIREH